MQRITSFIVRFHSAIFFAFMAIAVVCGFLAVHVDVNTDMTKYLPPEMQMKQGSDIMSEEFGDATIIDVMVTSPKTDDDRQNFADALDDFAHIDSVAYKTDDARYVDGDYTHYTLTVKADTYSDDIDRAMNEVKGACQSRGYECWIDTESLNNVTNNLTIVLVAAVAFAMVILFILAASWIEPLLLLFTIMIAVVINLGTNIIFGSISDTTYACGSILQLALSMDYLIMLLNRYRAEHVGAASPAQAMERAIAGGMKAIASSSATTIAGLLCLVLMSFTIGRDMGLVLAKGVFLSLVCAFAIMPALVLWFDGLMERTRKPSPYPQMKTLSAMSFKGRYVICGVFVVLLACGLAFKGLATPAYITPNKNPDQTAIAEHFELEQQVVVLYTSTDQDKSAALTKEIGKMDGVSEATSYATTLAKKQTAAKLADETDMDAGLLRMLYYYGFEDGKTPAMTGGEFASYIRNGFAQDMGDMMDSATADKLDSLADLVAGDLSASKSYSAASAYVALADHASIRRSTVEMIYLAHAANSDAYQASWKMSTEELMDLLTGKVLKDATFDDVIGDKQRTQILDAADQVEEGKANLVTDDYGRIICNVTYAADSAEMDALCTQLREKLDGELDGAYWLVGRGPMVQEMAASFDSEFNFISIVTAAAIFAIVAITFRNLIIPAVLVSLISTAFNWDMIFGGLAGEPIYYVAIIVVQAILMGATIDYAILTTTNYREARQTQPIREAVQTAYRNSIRTVSMSGSILVIVCLILGLTAGGITGQICLVISEGAFASVVLVLLVLPGLLAALDRLMVPKRERFEE